MLIRMKSYMQTQRYRWQLQIPCGNPPPPRELYEHVPDMDEFFETLAGINPSLSHSFGVGFWNSKGAPIWRTIREDVITSLEVALTHQTELTIFQACSDLLLAPTKLLRCLGFVPCPGQ